ncbi:MAG: SOS response-associated peptidase [Ferruginibacter sp.]
MCFHYSLTKERAEIEIQLGATWDDVEWTPVYHMDGFRFSLMPVITQDAPTRIQLLNWGLIPQWVKTNDEAQKMRAQTLNARSETIFKKPSFRSSISNSRCLVIMDGFFEWMDHNESKYPHYIYLDKHEIFCVGGIYTSWVDKITGELITSFSILTTDANTELSKVHNTKKRMPVIIPPNQYKTWLTANLPKEKIKSFFDPYPDGIIQYHTISKFISSKKYNTNVPETLIPYEYPELIPPPSLFE